ncbi:MAG TPA: hypothetical protein VI757_09170, partial [Bacteroidia bacterium]|nr:hypothetical protein [Bacteroidia bacterium]
MKKFLSVLFFAACVSAEAQITPSSCNASPAIRAMYRDDADRMVVRRLYVTNSPYADSVVIPQNLSDTLLDKLIAVYNATSLPARDSVIVMYNIHTFMDTALQIIDVHADSNLAWMQQLHLGNLNTGNAQVDNLITSYNLNLVSYSTNLSLFFFHSVRFEADTNINTYALTDMFSSIAGVYESLPLGWFGSGDDITDSITSNNVQLTYSYGWGDCPSGCIYNHYWKFIVYPDCSVEYVGSYGEPLPLPTGLSQEVNKNISALFPNPATNEIRIQNAELRIESVEIYDVL